MEFIKSTLLITSTLVGTAYSTLYAQQKPNILLVITDDQTFESIGSLNNKEIHTPNLDRLARRGTVFTHAYNQGSWSAAVSVASRCMLITGQSVFNCSLNDAYLDDWAKTEKHSNPTEVPLIGEVFQQNGYETIEIGKWHNSDHALLKSFEQARGIGEGMYETSDDCGSNKMAYQRFDKSTWDPTDTKYHGHWTPKVRNMIVNEKGEKTITPPFIAGQHTSELFADLTVDYLMKRDNRKGKPFFAFIAFNAPHDPRQSPKEFIDMYPVDNILIPENFLPEHPFDQGDKRIRDEMLAPFPRTKQAVQTHRQEYYAIISHCDREIGRILDALEASGNEKDTYIIFTSDHGLTLGMHGLMGKQNLYEHTIRVPFIISGPGIKAGEKINEMIYMQSIYPTICDLAGIDIPPTVDYTSILPVIRKQSKGEEYIFGAYKNLQRMVRSDRYKLILYPKVHEIQLFDMQNDPYETTNLQADPHYKKIKKKLLKELPVLQKKYNDTLDLSSFMK